MAKFNLVNNIDCIKGMKELPNDSIDLVVTSPPYNVGIKYDVYNDELSMDHYFKWVEIWLAETYRVLKDDGRIAINIPLEINVKDRGGRVFIASEYWQLMKKVGFKFFGIVELDEQSPHRIKNTAWGSYMSSSGPYIYNPKECVILAYKNFHIKQTKGECYWRYNEMEIENEEGVKKIKKIYSEQDKEEFMELVFGRWKYFADTKQLTKATFSLDIPLKAIKILSFKGDKIMDPFSGSGSTFLANEILGNKKNFIGFEISPEYTKIANQRVVDYICSKNQLAFDFSFE